MHKGHSQKAHRGVCAAVAVGTSVLMLAGCGDGGGALQGGDGVDVVESGLERVLTAPDVKVTSHIRDFSTDGYMAQLDAHPGISKNPLRRLAMVAGLSAIRGSANVEPPDAFGDETPGAMTWSNFASRKEHRGFVHLQNVTITCRDGKIVRAELPKAEVHPGWTKEPIGGGYTLGESLIEAADFRPGVRVARTDNHTCVQVTHRHGSRMNQTSRGQQRLVFGYDAAFIWTRIEQRLCCDGSTDLQVQHSAFPTHRVYVNDQLTSDVEQRGFADFLVSGGKDATAEGYGQLAPAHVAGDQS